MFPTGYFFPVCVARGEIGVVLGARGHNHGHNTDISKSYPSQMVNWLIAEPSDSAHHVPALH